MRTTWAVTAELLIPAIDLISHYHNTMSEAKFVKAVEIVQSAFQPNISRHFSPHLLRLRPLSRSP